MDSPMRFARNNEPVETNDDLSSSAGSGSVNEMPDDSDMGTSNQIKLSQNVVSGSGLDMYQAGDVIYAPVKMRLDGDDAGNIQGITIQAMGSAMEQPPESGDLIDLTSGAPLGDENDKGMGPDDQSPTKGEPNPEAEGENAITTTGENTTGEDADAGESAKRYTDANMDGPTEQELAEQKMLGYKRPKSKKGKMPRPGDFLTGER